MSLPRLFLVLPSDVEEERALTCLEAACGIGDVAALLLRAGTRSEDEGREGRLRHLVEAARRQGVAALVEGDPRLAASVAADGVHVHGAGEVGEARRVLGADAIVGAECRGRRHEAMRLGEAGVDYLAIDQHAEAGGERLLDWCVEMLVLPVVAFRPAGPAAAAELVRRKADFVRPSDALWESGTRAERTVEEIMRAMREAIADE